MAEKIVAAVRALLDSRDGPIVVAVDGPSGSGKSTIVRAIAGTLDATVVPSDDFFAANITDAEWDARTPADRAADAIDWRRMRREALDPLRAGLPAQWRAFDFDAGARADGTYGMRSDLTVRAPRRVIIIDGAYSARPELSELIDLSVQIDAPAEVRQERLAARESAEFLKQWHARWDVAETFYFTHVRPASAFDLIVSTASDSAAPHGSNR